MSEPIDQLKKLLRDLKESQEHNQTIDKLKNIIQTLKPLDINTEMQIYDDIHSLVPHPPLRQQLIRKLGLDFNHDQEHLQEKMKEFLKNEINLILNTLPEEDQKHYKESEDYKNRMEVIGKLESEKHEAGGECVGLSTLWAYGKRISDEKEKEKGNETLNKKAKDDIHFFNRTWKRLLLWNKKQELNQGEQRDFERFIANVRHYQNRFFSIAYQEDVSIDQLDLSHSLHDTKRGFPINCFDKSIPCDQRILLNRLESIVKPRTMIFFSCQGRGDSGHTMGLYQDSQNNIYFYDPNMGEGEVPIKDLHHLTQLLWDRSNPKLFEKKPGIDPLDDHLRKDLRMQVYRFPEDPAYNYPTDSTFKISTKEFLEMAKAIPWFSMYRHRPQVYALFNTLTEFQIIDVLQDKKVENNLKSALVEYAIRSTREKTPILTRYILQNQKDIINKIQEALSDNKDQKDSQDQQSERVQQERLAAFTQALEQFKAISKNIIDLKDYKGTNDNQENKHNKDKKDKKENKEDEHLLTIIKPLLNLNEVLIFLTEEQNFGNEALASDLLEQCTPDDRKTAFGLFSVLFENLQRGNIDYAKLIASILMEAKDNAGNIKFGIGLNAKGIFDLGSPEFAEFMHQKYGDRYLDRFGTPELQYMPILIKNHLIQDKKQALMRQATDLWIQSGDEKEKKDTKNIIEKINQGAKELKEFLSLEDALIILAINPGNQELADTLLNHCIKGNGKPFAYAGAIQENLQQNHLETAKRIVSIVAKRFDLFPSFKFIQETENEEFADFMHINYGDQYLDIRDKFGTPELQSLSKLIPINRHNRQLKEKITEEALALLNTPTLNRETVAIQKLHEIAFRNLKLLNHNGILNLLALSEEESTFKTFLDEFKTKFLNSDHYLDRSFLAHFFNEQTQTSNNFLCLEVLQTILPYFNLDRFMLISSDKLTPASQKILQDFLQNKKMEEDMVKQQEQDRLEQEQRERNIQIQRDEEANKQFKHASFKAEQLELQVNLQERTLVSELDFSKDYVRILKNIIARELEEHVFPFNATLDFKQSINNSCEEFLNKFIQSRQKAVHELKELQNAAQNEKHSLEQLRQNSLIIDKKDKMDSLQQMILSLDQKIESLEKNTLEFTSQVKHLEEEIEAEKKSAYNILEQQRKTFEHDQHEVSRIQTELLDHFNDAFKDFQNQIQECERQLDMIRKNLRENILNGSLNSLTVALQVRNLANQIDDTQLSLPQNTRKTFSTYIDRIYAMYENRQIQFETVAAFANQAREAENTLQSQIKEIGDTFNRRVKTVFDEIFEASTIRRNQEQEKLFASPLIFRSKPNEDSDTQEPGLSPESDSRSKPRDTT